MGADRKIKSFEELSFTDDYMFCKVLMLNPDLCKELLELILGRKIRRLRILNSQQPIEITSDGRGIRLDLYMEDDEDSVYDMEMQVVDRGNLPKRSRYYQGMIDLNLIQRGSDFNELKKSYVIFICKFDPFGYGRHLYVFENACRDVPELKLNDEMVKVFLNAYGDAKDVSEEMAAFLQLLQGSVVENPLARRIEDAVQKVKSQEEWKVEYMTLAMRDREMKEAGRKEGRIEGRIEGRTEGRSIGREEILRLNKWLLSQNRIEEAMQMAEDAELCERLLAEYAEQNGLGE